MLHLFIVDIFVSFEAGYLFQCRIDGISTSFQFLDAIHLISWISKETRVSCQFDVLVFDVIVDAAMGDKIRDECTVDVPYGNTRADKVEF